MSRKVLWQKHVKQWEGSGMSQSAYCRRESISLTSFCNWKKRFEDQTGKEQFVEIGKDSSTDKIEILLSSGTIVRLPLDVSASRLQEIAKCLS